jgi:signal transduction histidine kinase
MSIRWPRPTVRLRLALTYTALFVVTGAALLGVSYLLVQHREGGAGTATQIICRRSGSVGQVQIKGVLPGPPPGGLQISPQACPGVVGVFYHSSNGGAVKGVITAGNGQTVQVPAPTAAAVRQLTTAVAASQAHTLDSFKVESAIALGLVTILSFGLSWWMAGRVLRPVHRITDTARRLSERTLHSRINLQGPRDELKELADTFDAMLARLDRAFQSQRRFVANASHELRTPLATERVLIDEALANPSAEPEDFRGILAELRANSEQTEHLVDALLVLARSEQGIQRRSDVDLGALAQSVLADASSEASLRGVELRSNLSEVTVNGDPALLQRLIGNVVENGVRHNVSGGWLEVTIKPDGPQALIEVSNTGPVLDDATVATLIEPFRRAGPDRRADDGGCGIGLSVVDAVVNAHHGTLTLRPRPEGGLILQVRLAQAIK